MINSKVVPETPGWFQSQIIEKVVIGELKSSIVLICMLNNVNFPNPKQVESVEIRENWVTP